MVVRQRLQQVNYQTTVLLRCQPAAVLCNSEARARYISADTCVCRQDRFASGFLDQCTTASRNLQYGLRSQVTAGLIPSSIPNLSLRIRERLLEQPDRVMLGLLESIGVEVVEERKYAGKKVVVRLVYGPGARNSSFTA